MLVYANFLHQENPKAEKYETLTWQKFKGIVGETWSPGLNSPFDPIAAKKCHTLNIEVALLAGDDVKNVEAALRGEKFKGTIVKN